MVECHDKECTYNSRNVLNHCKLVSEEGGTLIIDESGKCKMKLTDENLAKLMGGTHDN